MTNHYDSLHLIVRNHTGISIQELDRRIKLAQLWHNPMNVDNGEPLKEKYGWDIMFTDALRKEKIWKRDYFDFHGDIDMADVDLVFESFLECDNWNKYCRIWRENAPKEFNNKWIYLLALVEMTVRGLIHEGKEIQKSRDAGHDVRMSTPAEDRKGTDFWEDGKPIQVKSPATQAMIDRKNIRGV